MDSKNDTINTGGDPLPPFFIEMKGERNMEEIKFENKDGKKKLEARCYWGLSVEQEVMDNPKLLKRLESLNNITFDDDIKASILDIEAVCELIRMIGAGYVNGIVFGPTIMPSKPYLELKVLEELCKHMGCDTVFDLSAIKAFKTFEMDDSIEEMFHSIECEMLELLLEGWTESLLGFE